MVQKENHTNPPCCTNCGIVIDEHPAIEKNKELIEALEYLLEGVNGLPHLTAIEGTLTKHCIKAKAALK